MGVAGILPSVKQSRDEILGMEVTGRMPTGTRRLLPLQEPLGDSSSMCSALLPIFPKIRASLFLVQLIYDIVSSAPSVERCPEGLPPAYPSFLSFTTIPTELAGRAAGGPRPWSLQVWCLSLTCSCLWRPVSSGDLETGSFS